MIVSGATGAQEDVSPGNQVTGRNDVKSPTCNIYKASFPAALHLEALRLLKYTAPVTLQNALPVTHITRLRRDNIA